MKIEDFAYIVETKKSFDDAVISVRKSAENNGWVIFQVHDYKEIMAVKGFKQKPLKIIEICNAKFANQFLNKNRFISLFMPCNINVLEENGKIKIMAMKITAISQFFPEVSKQEAEKVEKVIKKIIDNAK